VHRSGDVVALAPTGATALHSKRVAIDLVAAPVAHGRVAVLDDRVRGFLAWSFDARNRRMAIDHFHVDRPYRRRGAGRGLIDAAVDWARRAGALTVWLAASSVNHAAIAAYHRLGFEICGFDTTLYRGTAHQGEVAVYLARLVDGDARPHAGGEATSRGSSRRRAAAPSCTARCSRSCMAPTPRSSRWRAAAPRRTPRTTCRSAPRSR
jgi:ribosomal protein S18 acetylase RimI-like enzyme